MVRGDRFTAADVAVLSRAELDDVIREHAQAICESADRIKTEIDRELGLLDSST